ncbi:MAG: hypothetical protein CM15mP21_0980 [Hyphomicrobiales bacterium]|nr:MAG: hypothetical protein CM15mP21_0980 [Hyphomicrobiales bacterium]
MQNFIGHCKGFGKCRLGIGDAEQVLVRDDDKRINFLGGSFMPSLADRMRLSLSKSKGLVTTPTVTPQFACGAGNHVPHRCRCPPMPAVTKAICEPCNMSTFQPSTLGGLTADSGFEPAPNPSVSLPHLNSAIGLAGRKCLCVGICDDKIDAFQPCAHHIIDRIATSAPDAKHDNTGFKFPFRWNGKMNTHGVLLFYSFVWACFPKLKKHATLRPISRG